VAVLGLAGGVIAVILGPWLIQVFFAAHRVLGPTDFALLTAGTLFFMLALVLGQGAMALSHHRDQLLAWIGGAVVLAVITAVPGDVRLRVELAYAVSALTVATTLAIVLSVRAARYWDPPAVADGPVAATVHPGGSR
jgi:O-antigen/teichoic acid export membrane protein